MVTTAMAHFGIVDFKTIQRMTLYEYELRNKAYLMQFLDKEKDIHLLAYLGNVVTATDKDGNPAFKKFRDFYDFEKRKEEVFSKKLTESDNRLMQIAKRVAEYRMKGGTE